MGIRFPYSFEITGELHIANDSLLIGDIEEKFDIIIGEAKTGSENKPNKVWKQNHETNVKEYILKFIGLFKNKEEIVSIANELSNNYHYKNDKNRIRYIIFSESENNYYKNRGVTYITYDHIVDFLVEVRG